MTGVGKCAFPQPFSAPLHRCCLSTETPAAASRRELKQRAEGVRTVGPIASVETAMYALFFITAQHCTCCLYPCFLLMFNEGQTLLGSDLNVKSQDYHLAFKNEFTAHVQVLCKSVVEQCLFRSSCRPEITVIVWSD